MISYVDTQRVNTEIYGVLEKIKSVETMQLGFLFEGDSIITVTMCVLKLNEKLLRKEQCSFVYYINIFKTVPDTQFLLEKFCLILYIRGNSSKRWCHIVWKEETLLLD